MINIPECDAATEWDGRCWILYQGAYARKDRHENLTGETAWKRTTYHATLSQVADTILASLGKDAKDIRTLLSEIVSEKEMLQRILAEILEQRS